MQSPAHLRTPLLLFLGALVLYGATTTTTLLGADNPEFVTLFAVGGVPHPPGYPVYLLWLRMFSWLPVANACQGAGLATAFLGAGMVSTLFLTQRSWGVRDSVALVTTIFFSLLELPWRLSSQAEVFAGNALLAGCILTLSGPKCAVTPERRAYLLALLAGLCIGNHLSSVLLAPVGLYAFGVSVGASHSKGKTLAGAAAALVVGLSPYLLLFLWSKQEHAYLWRTIESARDLADHLLRRDFGTTQLAARGELQSVEQLRVFCVFLLKTTAGLLLVLPLLGVYKALRESRDRRHFLALFSAFLLVGPVFLSRFNIAPVGTGARIIERFYLLPMFLLSVFSGVAIDRWLPETKRSIFANAALVLLLGLLGTHSYLQLREERGSEIEDYARDVLTGLPLNAVLLGFGDHRLFGIGYSQHVLGIRRDVQYVDAYLLPLEHYRTRLGRRLGVTFPPAPGGRVSTVAVANVLLSTGRPLRMTGVFNTAIPSRFALWPEGLTLHVATAGAPAPAFPELLSRNEALYRGYRLGPARGDEQDWRRSVREDYARTWFQLAAVAARTGNSALAETLRSRGARYAPWFGTR